MNNPKYKNQVRLLLDVLLHVAKEECFALHGGTAINLFVRDMPRLSVDIDLTYLPIEDRATTLNNIREALGRIKKRIGVSLPQVQVVDKPDIGKLVIRAGGDEIKLEVNLVIRGTITLPKRMILCDKAQETYDLSTVINVVPFGQLYGGKICAALSRQHPRDLFDIKILLGNEGLLDEVRQGFLLCLLCSDKPISDMLAPNFHDQRQAMENQFAGMSDLAFSYEDFEHTRVRLVQAIKESLSTEEKSFLLSFKNCTPDWSIYDFERFPAVQWKLQNLHKLKKSNPEKHQRLYKLLEKELIPIYTQSISRIG